MASTGYLATWLILLDHNICPQSPQFELGIPLKPELFPNKADVLSNSEKCKHAVTSEARGRKCIQRCGNLKKKKIRRWGKPLIQVGGKKCIGEQGRGGKCKKLKGSNSSLALLRAIFLLFGNRRQIFSTTRLSKLIPKLNMSFFLNISIS